jgi:formylglycine-generating enzyme required for sulfatase activity
MLILHISDLHLGPHSRFDDDQPEEVAGAFCRELAAARTDAGIDGEIDLVCVTGDVTEAARPAELEHAGVFFAALADGIGVERRRFVFVPGNHDVSWFACKRIEIEQDEYGFADEELRTRMDQVKLESFFELVSSFWEVEKLERAAISLGHDGYLVHFPELRLSVAALSSCEQESHQDQDHIGRLSKDQTQALLDHWREGEAAGWLKIACVHHNPSGAPPVVTEDWREHLQESNGFTADIIDRFAGDLAGFEGRDHLRAVAEDCGVQLVLHGHQHARGGQSWPWKCETPGNTHVLAAGSWGLNQDKLPGSEPASARLIEIDLDAGLIQAHILSNLAWARITGSVTTGGMVVDRHPQQLTLSLPPGWSVDHTNVEMASEEEISQYCDKVESLHATLPLAGFQTRLRVPLDLKELYVPLQAMVDLRGVGDACFGDAGEAEKQLREVGGALEIPLLDAFQEGGKRRRNGIVILGDPGSGKTTHLKRLLLWCLREDVASLGLAPGIMPVFLPLRELRDLDQGLDAFIESQLYEPHLQSSPGLGRRLLERGNLLLLLDGLDEVADTSQREQVARWIDRGLAAHPTCRLVVTCRFAGYTPEVRLSERFLELHLRPLNAEQAERFVHRWYRIVETGLAPDPEQGAIIARQRAAELVARLKEPDFRARRVFELTRNPLLLANLCLVHRDRGHLPRQRAKLYAECVDVLLERWREAKQLPVGISADTGRKVLQPLALWLHEEEGRSRAGADQIAPVIEPVLSSARYEGGGAREFLHTIRDESGLLTGWGDEQFGFMHLGFQEYLAAREIARRSYADESILAELAGHFGESWWQEVSLLLLAQEELPLFKPFMRQVVRLPAFANHPDLVEACLDDALEVNEAPFVELVESAAGTDPEQWVRQLSALRVLERRDSLELDRLKRALQDHPSPEIRAWLGVEAAKAAVEVIRPEPSGYELVLIPGGTFQMGSPKSEKGRYGDEGPQHEVTVDSFYIGRYPVTNEEYGKFLKAKPGEQEPAYWGDRRYNKPRQPVVGVSWNDARRYAEWAGLRLPSEGEWEYACRAGTSSRYHSGDDEDDLTRDGWYHSNSGGKPHPVGEKEANAFGLCDVHGNVWEWCEDDWHGTYQGAQTNGRAWIDQPRGSGRVLRGGSWFNDARGVRSACRNGRSPDDRGISTGFRLARGQE